MEDEKYDLMRIIQIKFPRLSKGQKLIAEYILKHYDKAAFMTAARLGVSVGVSESTVVRFANELGFSGYPKLQKALHELIKNKLTTVQRIELSNTFIAEESSLKGVLKADIENIRVTLEKINHNVFDDVVNSIFSAKRIYIIGLRSSTALAEFLGFYLNLILDNVYVVSYKISDIFEQIINITSDDLLIGIGFPRYASRTIEALSFAKSRKTKVVALTDSLLSPLATEADYTLIAQSNMASFVDSLVAPLSVINALIVSVGLREKDRISNVFTDLENIWKRYKVYSSRSTDDKF
ncbi:DNA-binding MurR/RpiR family transcriptional regulator [Clostridium acetobutylicum]|uniref:Transcriptional regulators, RpiR family n=1 Tax=Clostridium acetobutylicum (strain ATCC 824 / DSM 792 / JCM 1419 / IAM 19013 / LMG 5710 / NBRC 13948 / NRRL B-527 / VKM B-1787 / 2291 / W) TaxID=272562 RepID=Q97I06_CLOAB|nr:MULTISPECIES: MurR/RpiR family transcriptional regulator [Clostridium]AAK79814.1 Transcriptional regulators, RpiR family [Clostridium acetobutylicum ATCC 824]ADZ20900.1 Transcriptional regulator, RpiR family [Clostridium acetobutylicum EA 2018]AEI31996.1 RpiR family transcriptional regulator [Clostridium acetobutylicum DSM 1731]AWV79753.1 MurR/RpiR family transcriptional regulator [Clostridium acetobutylicum]KHD38141.1 N-acetylmannosamine kinase [Clostridium acetobutylicum]